MIINVVLAYLFTALATVNAGEGFEFTRDQGSDLYYTGAGWLKVSALYDDYPDHFFLDADIGNARYRFVVDTGASTVFLPYEVAKKNGLACNPAVSQTASGEMQSCTATLPELDVSGISFSNIQVSYPMYPESKELEPWPLLGMDVLGRMDVKYINQALYLRPKTTTDYAPWLLECLRTPHLICKDPLSRD